MPAFHSRALEDLTRQLTYAPAERVRKQMDQAEELFWQIEPERNYPLEYVVFRVTGFRPVSPPEETLTGTAIRHDLPVMVEALSEAIGDRAEHYSPRPSDLPSLCKQLRVTGKTISRYRRDGLFARRLIWGGGRKKLGFRPASVALFMSNRAGKIEAASRFHRIEEEERHRIITRARRIVARTDATLIPVARHLALKFRRSTEAVRQLLLRHDRHDPRVAIFPDHAPPLKRKQQRVLYRAYLRGVPVTQMADRYGRSRNAVYRAINLRRAERLREMKITFVPLPTFELPEAEQVILGPELDTKPRGKSGEIGAKNEAALFARYNYLKFQAATWLGQLDRHHPASSRLDRIETCLRRAVSVKQSLVEAYLRLVVSTAKKHMAGSRDTAAVSLADLVGEGNLVLVEAIETFDAGRGNRFSTYLTWAMMRRFAQHVPGRATPKSAEPPAARHEAVQFEESEHLAHSLGRLLGELNERERFILSHHFGLSDASGQPLAPRTLAEVAAQLHLSPERARQIEHRALLKLRELATKLKL